MGAICLSDVVTSRHTNKCKFLLKYTQITYNKLIYITTVLKFNINDVCYLDNIKNWELTITENFFEVLIGPEQ